MVGKTATDPMSKELTSLDVAKGSGVVSAAEKDTLVITEPKKVTKKRVKRKIEGAPLSWFFGGRVVT